MAQTRSRFLRGIMLLLRRYYGHHVGRDSAALTYYLLFAIFPLLIFFSNLVGLFAMDIGSFLVKLSAIIPEEALELILQYLQYISEASSEKLLGFSLVFSIWFPFRAANSLFASVRKAYGLGPSTHFLLDQGKVLLFTLALLLMFPLSLLIVAVGDNLLSFVARFIYISEHFIVLWSSLRFVLLAVIVFCAIIALYALAQDRPTVRYMWPGVLFSLTAWMALALCFSLYVENMGRYSLFYGSIGTIIILLIWLYLAATMLILGAEFNCVLAELRDANEEVSL